MGEVTIDVKLKRVNSVMREGEGGDPQVTTTVVLEGDDLLEEDVKQLLGLQHEGRLRVRLVPVQGKLPLPGKPGKKPKGEPHHVQAQD